MLGRPRQFDEQEVLERAMDMFWSKGYEATSTRELALAMEISQQSLYNTFGNKHQLYLRTLDHYQETFSDPFQSKLVNNGASIETLREFMYALAKDYGSAEERRSCFMANSTMELGARDQDVQERIKHHLTLLEERIDMLLQQERERGRLHSRRSTRELARFLSGVIQGLHIFNKAGYSVDMMRQHIDVALDVVICSGP
ncbi:TetR family transcriptional regulator [bacterium]|nr:TetR family transcriptional regulator [bacterium]